MFDRLRKKWKVGPGQLVLILLTFAIGGSLTGFVGKKIMNGLSIGEDWLWAILYIILITIIWPMAVLLISFPFGQFAFFSTYIRKIGVKLGILKDKEAGSSIWTRVAVFASGAGSNAAEIIRHFEKNEKIRVSLVVCNNPGAGVLNIAAANQVPALLIEKERFFHGDAYLPELKALQIDFIVLAGFLWKIPGPIISAYPNHIINIHPALLPKYGGKGMYGSHVHQAVIDNKEKESGISIHYVDEKYDNGDIIFQAKCPVLENDNVASLAQRIHALEHKFYPGVIENTIQKTS